MMNNLTKFSPNSDDEDIEALRLAALQSLKKPASGDQHLFINHNSPEQWSKKGFRSKRGKFYGQHHVWGRKEFQTHGHFNRVRSSNLIPITTISEESKNAENIPKDKTDKETPIDIASSKFNRYDKSDKSDSDSEDELLSSDNDNPGNLERSDSLEALMQELDDEIQGKPKIKDKKEEKTKMKKVKKKKKISESENKDSDPKITTTEEQKNSDIASEELPNTGVQVKTDEAINEIKKSPTVNTDQPSNSPQGKFYGRKRPRSRSPHNRRGFPNRRRPRNFPGGPPITQPMHIPFGQPPPLQYPPHMIPFPEQFNPMFMPPIPNPLAPPFFERARSPLSINTESLTTATMAPLSPRSAAFVLQNKAIIERRKRSPRRSYSRSLSRSPRRSLTPRRSPRRSVSPRRSRSPRRLPHRKRSLSPRKRSLSPRKRSLSPRRRSLSPRKKSLSPKRRNIDNIGDNRAPVRERLGVKSKPEEPKDKEKTKKEEEEVKKEEKPIDPILEARRKKFETNEIKKREGIIRLRPKDDKPDKSVEKPKEEIAKIGEKPKVEEKPKIEETPKVEEKPKPKLEKPKENIVEVAPATTTVEEKPSQSEKDLSVPDEFTELEKLLNEDALLEGDENIDYPKVDDIFSDEDSNSDNEGRFKVKEQNITKPQIISFTKLVNGTKTEIKSEALPSNSIRNREVKKEKGSRERARRKFDRSHTPPLLIKKALSNIEVVDDKHISNTEKAIVKHKISHKPDRQPPLMDKRFERKIEIKIKNPSKYEKSGKSKISKIEESIPSKVERKVNIADKEDEDDDDDEEDFEPEIIVENDSSSDEYSNITEGDLRAQLSKKRAKKLHKIPVDEVSSRLLQYALQGAVFKKKKKSKSKDLASSDGKLPIHLRLGLANLERPKRKSRKRKNREVLEQV